MGSEMCIRDSSEAHGRWREQQQALKTRRQALEAQQQELQTRFGEERRARDEAEAAVAEQRQVLQQARWELERLREERTSLEEQLRNGGLRLEELRATLPDPLPEIDNELRESGLLSLQERLQQLQLRMEALEPVNMLALEELGELEQRLGDLGLSLIHI